MFTPVFGPIITRKGVKKTPTAKLFEKNEEPEADSKKLCKFVRVGKISPGDMLGQYALLHIRAEERKHISTARTVSVVNAYSLHKRVIPGVIRDQPAIALTLQIALGQAMQSMTEKHSNMKLKRTRTRFYFDILNHYHHTQLKTELSGRSLGDRMRRRYSLAVQGRDSAFKAVLAAKKLQKWGGG